MKKRIVSFILIVCMLLSMLPITVLAAAVDPDDEETFALGNTFTADSENAEPPTVPAGLDLEWSGPESTVSCGKTAHAHTSYGTNNCYSNAGALICEEDEHAHDEDCYDTSRTTCRRSESRWHTHSWENGCYDLECTTEEHAHSVANGCYEASCGIEEHAHESECYSYTWTLVRKNVANYFYYRFSAEASNSTLYYTTDGRTLKVLGRGEVLELNRDAPVVFYVAIAPGYTSGSAFQHRNSSSSFTGTWGSGTYTPIASAPDSLGSLDLETSNALAVAAGCDYEFHYSAKDDVYRYREFRITGTSTQISVEYSVDGKTNVIVDNNNYRHPDVTDAGYADYLTQITIPEETPTKSGYTFAGWAFRGGIYRAGDTLEIADLWSAEINTDVTYTFEAQWTANPSELTITKVVSGGPGGLPDDFEIIVTGSNGYSTTLDLDDVASASGNTYIWVLDNLTRATYNVTESGCDMDGYTLQEAASTVEGSVSLGNGQKGSVTLRNIYALSTYTVVWEDEDGNVLETDEDVPYGTPVDFDGAEQGEDYETCVSFGGTIPEKDATDQYSYVFAGWDPEVDVITGDVTFSATYAPATNTYTVIWEDEDGTVLETDERVAYGTMPIYNGELPARAPDEQYHYVFAGWSPEVTPVTGDVTYTATFETGNVRTYTVVWHDYNRVAIETDHNVPYGTPVDFDGAEQGVDYANCVSYNGETPTKPADANYTYQFTGWRFYRGTALVNGEVVGSVEFEPVFEEIPIPRTATVEVILDGAADSATESVTGGTHMDISELVTGADNAIYLQLADGTGDYIELEPVDGVTGVYSHSGMANGEYKIYTKVGAAYTQLGVQLITIDNCDDTDYAPFYSVSYADGAAAGEAVSMPETAYYYIGAHVDVSSRVPKWDGYVFAGWTAGGVTYQPSTALENVHMVSGIRTRYVLTAAWEDTVNVNVVVEVDRKGDTEYYKNDLYIYLTQKNANNTYANVPGSLETVSGWYGSGSGSSLSYSLTDTYTGLDKNGVYAAEATLFGYKHVSTTVSEPDEDTNTYTVTVKLEYDPTGFELAFDIYVDASMPARFVPSEVDVKITRWDGENWVAIADHTNSTTTVYIDTDSVVTIDGKTYYKGTGSHHVYAFDTDQNAYLYRIEPVNLDAIGTYAETLARAAYYSVSMSDPEQPHVQYISGDSGFFPEGAYTGTVSAGKTCENGLSSGGLYGTHVFKDGETYVQHDRISVYISVHPYTIEFDLNGGTGEEIEPLANRFTVPVLDNYIPVREGYSFVGWYRNAAGTGDPITGGEYINSYVASAGGTLTLYAKWDADFTVSGKVEANMGYPCSDTSRSVTVILQRKNAGGVYVDYRSMTAALDTLNGTVASGTYEFVGVPSDADYRIYVAHSAGTASYRNETSDAYAAGNNAAVRGADDAGTTDVDESLIAVVDVSIVADQFALGYVVDASAISEGYRPTDILIKLCHDHNNSQYYEAIAELNPIRDLDLNEDADGISRIYTDVLVPTHHANGSLFNYVLSVYSYDFAPLGWKDKQHEHYLDDAASRVTFAPFVVDYIGPANYSAAVNSDGLNQSVVLNVIFRPNTYAINYELNNGSWTVGGSAIRTHVWSYDTEIKVTPVREGYVFRGWVARETESGAAVTLTKDANGAYYVPAAVWKNVTLTAQWAPAGYTISYDLAGGSLPSGKTNPAGYTVESAGFTLVNPVREGYTFAGWTGTGVEEAAETVTIPAGSVGNRAYTATWTLNRYDITVEVVNGMSDRANPVSVTHGGTITISFTKNAGYALDSVIVDGEVAVLSNGSYTFRNVTAAHTIKVVYAADTVLGSDDIPDKYQAVVTYMVTNGSFAAGFDDKVKFTLKEYKDGLWSSLSPAPTLGDTIPLVSTHMIPNTGWTTVGSWNVTPTSATAVAGNRTYIWTFTEVQKLDVTYSDHGKYTGNKTAPGMSSVTVEYGDVVAVDPNGGSWTSALVSGAESAYTQAQYVTVTADGTLENPTRDYYIFIGWKWELVSAVDLEGRFTAQWAPVEYALHYVLNGGALPAGARNPDSYTIEDSFTLANPVKAGYVFEGWTGTGLNTAAKEVTVSAGAFGDRTYTATWSAAANTAYTIRYYLEDLNADTFTECEAERVTGTGTTGTEVTVSGDTLKRFEGFTFDNGNEENLLSAYIEADGSLELKVYYTRNRYTVEYVNEDEVLQTKTVDYGDTIPAYTGSAPTKTDANPAQYTHIFSGWSLETGSVGAGNTVIGNLTYKANYTQSTNVYTVVWEDHDGTVLKTESLAYGAEPEYDGVPTRGPDEQNSYAFKQWLDKENKLSDGKVVCDVTLTADYTPTARKFTGRVELYLEVDGSDVLTDVETLLGSGAKLYFSADGSTYYALSGADGVYSNANMPNGDYKLYHSADGVTYTLVCEQTLTIYGSAATAKEYFHTVSYSVNEGTGGPTSPAYCHEGDAVTVSAPAPTRTDYVFEGWWYDADGNGSVDAGELYQIGNTLTSGIRNNYVLTARWTETQGLTFVGESKIVTYNGMQQTVTGITVVGLPEGYTYSGLSYRAAGTGVNLIGYMGVFTGKESLVIKDSSGNVVTNYFRTWFINGKLTIEPATLTVTADTKSKSYDGDVFEGFTSTVTGFVNGETIGVVSGSISYTGDAATEVDAGTYTITPVLTDLRADNYVFTSADGTLTIHKVQMTIKAADKEKVYDGDPYDGFTYTVTGFVNGEDASVLTGTVTYNAEAVNAVAAGTYEIIPNVIGLRATNYTFVPAGGTLIIHADANGDGIADKNQKKVTFKVVNGTWGNGITEKTVYIELDGTGVGIMAVPSGMTANTGYANGAWSPSLPQSVTGTDAVVYTYTYEQVTGLSYTVKCWLKGTTTLLGSKVIGEQTGGTEIVCADQKFDIVGYTYDSTERATLILDLDSEKNIINLYYVKDESQTKELSYTVEYYKSGVKVESDTQTVTKTVWVNDPDTLTVDKAAINVTNKYLGHKFSSTDPAEIPDTIATGGTIKVYYTANYVPPVAPGVTTGSVTVKKVDSVDAKTTLSDVVFDLYDENGTVVGTYTTGADGTFTVSQLTTGKYYWVEIRPHEGYTRDTGKHGFTVVGGQSLVLTISNARTDVPDVFGNEHYAYIIGYSDGMVRPLNQITRAEVATIFFRLLNDETRNRFMTKKNSFSDVDEGDWFNTAVSTMAAMGIINGYPDGSFGPNDKITRAEFAAIAARFDSNGNTTGASFVDIYGHWAQKEINIASNNGWILGYEDGTFRPNQPITRAEAMTMVNRVLQRIPETAGDLVADMCKWPDNMNKNTWYYLPVQEATNSHTYSRKPSGYEYWIELRETRDWALLER